ncbi:hypothetical protein HAX54_035440, partial [Datura stramonium]|nr:hypothetical protein [Datura stramonium]
EFVLSCNGRHEPAPDCFPEGLQTFQSPQGLSMIAANASPTAAAPIERVKLLIQNQDEMIKTGRLSRNHTKELEIVSEGQWDEGAVSLWRETLLMLSVISLLRITSRDSSTSRRTVMATGSGLLATLHLVVLLVLPRCSLSTHWISAYRLANDAKAAKKGGERQFNGMVDVYRKTLASDGVAGLYRGFNISCVGIIVYRGLYFGMYDSLKPILLTGGLQDNFFASFALGWLITNGAGLASYPIDTVRRRMMMTSGEAVKYKAHLAAFSRFLRAGSKSLFKGAGATSFVPLLVLVCWLDMISFQMIVLEKCSSGGA